MCHILTIDTLVNTVNWFTFLPSFKTECQCHRTALLQLSFSKELKLLQFCFFKVSNILESLEKMESISVKLII